MSSSAVAALPAAGRRSPEGWGRSTAFAAGLLLVAVSTVAATVYGNGSIVLAAAPVLLAVLLAATWLAPLRIPLFFLIFGALSIDGTEGPWRAPWEPLGVLLNFNLNMTFPVPALAFPGAVAVLAYLFLVHLHRVITGVRVDRIERTPVPPAFLQALAVSFFAVIGLCLVGAQNGGDIQMAKIQVQTYIFVLLVAYLSAMCLRDVRDYRTLGRVVVVAGCIKAAIAIYVVHTIVPPFELANGKLAFATAHGDSLLFSVAAVILVVQFAERPVLRNALLCGLLLPLLVGGMYFNNRRLVWVELAAALVTFWIISRRSALKRLVVRAILVAMPVFVAYVAVGWSSAHPIFAPVRTFRSVGDSDVDTSTLYRDLENFNLVATIKESPLIGKGFGHPFLEPVKLPDISFFKEYRYMPHNSALGLWAFSGPFGFAGLVLALVVAVYLAVASYDRATSPDERMAAFMVVAIILIFMVHCWGDIGFSERRSVFLLGPALAMAGQLAVSTGVLRARKSVTARYGVR